MSIDEKDSPVQACSLDEHGLACKSQKLADRALEAAYESGVIDERQRVLKIITDNMDEMGMFELIDEIVRDI